MSASQVQQEAHAKMGGKTCRPGMQHSMLSSMLEWNLDVIPSSPSFAIVDGPGGQHAAQRAGAGFREEISSGVHILGQHVAAAHQRPTVQEFSL